MLWLDYINMSIYVLFMFLKFMFVDKFREGVGYSRFFRKTLNLEPPEDVSDPLLWSFGGGILYVRDVPQPGAVNLLHGYVCGLKVVCFNHEHDHDVRFDNGHLECQELSVSNQL